MPNNPITGNASSPVQDVFGSERQTPHAMFDRSRREQGWTPENPNGSGAAGASAEMDLALGCPLCKIAGVVGARLVTRPNNGYYCKVNSAHKWMDLDELMGMNPEKLQFKPKQVRQIGFTQVQVEVPGAVAEAFMKKFGDRGAATLSAVMDVLSRRAMVLGEDDLKNIEDRLGQPVPNAAFLAGQIFTMKTQLDEEKATVTRLRANLQTVARGVQVSDSAVLVDLGDELADKVRQQAASREWSPESYVAEATRLAIEGGWV